MGKITDDLRAALDKAQEQFDEAEAAGDTSRFGHLVRAELDALTNAVIALDARLDSAAG